jgi:hypothetical protein
MKKINLPAGISGSHSKFTFYFLFLGILKQLDIKPMPPPSLAAPVTTLTPFFGNEYAGARRDAAKGGRVSSYLEPARLRSSSAAHNAIASNIRTASDRDGWPGSWLRHSSMSCCHSGSSRRLTTGVWPVRGRPRFFRITIFESDMARVLQ